MRFIGIDLAWGPRNTTACVALDGQFETITKPDSAPSLLPGEAEPGFDSASETGPGETTPVLRLTPFAHAEALHSDADLLAFVRQADDGGGLVIGIDAPLDVPNRTGERPVEAALRRCFGPFQAGAHPANRTLFKEDVRGERLAARLRAELNIVNDFTFAPGDGAVRRCLEVFPHPAQVTLFGLARTLKYKAKPGRDYASRQPEYARLVAGLRDLALANPALLSPEWLAPPTGLIGGALKRREDLFDALLCAYVAAYYWQWGDGERCMVIGDQTSGYVITPITPALRACVQTFFQRSRQFNLSP